MPTIFVAFILIAVIFSICLLLLFLDKKQKQQKTRQLLDRFSKIGTKLMESSMFYKLIA
jgi:preprotein translocase subunit YajC